MRLKNEEEYTKKMPGKPRKARKSHTAAEFDLDTPWAIMQASDHELVRVLRKGGYTRYQHVTAHGLHMCMDLLIREYEGSLIYMLDSSLDEDEFSKRLQKLYGVGPKIAEIFTRETEEAFARRME